MAKEKFDRITFDDEDDEEEVEMPIPPRASTKKVKEQNYEERDLPPLPKPQQEDKKSTKGLSPSEYLDIIKGDLERAYSALVEFRQVYNIK